MNKSVDDLTMTLAKAGQPFASVIARSERRRSPNRVPGRQVAVINLVYTIDQGERLYVERIDIHGNTKTRDDVIRREFDFGEGDAYNRALVDRAERRLKALGYFKTVKITRSRDRRRIASFSTSRCEEQQPAISRSPAATRRPTGMLAQVSISDNNFLGTGDFAKASVTYGQYAQGFDLAFTDPMRSRPRLSARRRSVRQPDLRQLLPVLNSTIYGAKLLVGTPLNEQLGVTWNYSIYNQGLSLDPAIGPASLPIQQAAAGRRRSGCRRSATASPTRRSTMPRIRPAAFAPRPTTISPASAAPRNFARTTDDVRYYHPIVGDVVGMVRGQSGYVTPWGGQQLPLLDGFFGGPQLVRGFAPNGFGPRDITPGTTMDNLGGNAYWTTSAELQAPVPGVPADANLKMALFSDVGSLWATSASSVSSVSSLTPAQQIANARAPRCIDRHGADLGFAVRPASGRLRLPDRQEAVRPDPAPAIFRRRILTLRRGLSRSKQNDDAQALWLTQTVRTEWLVSEAGETAR